MNADQMNLQVWMLDNSSSLMRMSWVIEMGFSWAGWLNKWQNTIPIIISMVNYISWRCHRLQSSCRGTGRKCQRRWGCKKSRIEETAHWIGFELFNATRIMKSSRKYSSYTKCTTLLGAHFIPIFFCYLPSCQSGTSDVVVSPCVFIFNLVFQLSSLVYPAHTFIIIIISLSCLARLSSGAQAGLIEQIWHILAHIVYRCQFMPYKWHKRNYFSSDSCFVTSRKRISLVRLLSGENESRLLVDFNYELSWEKLLSVPDIIAKNIT